MDQNLYNVGLHSKLFRFHIPFHFSLPSFIPVPYENIINRYCRRMLVGYDPFPIVGYMAEACSPDSLRFCISISPHLHLLQHFVSFWSVSSTLISAPPVPHNIQLGSRCSINESLKHNVQMRNVCPGNDMYIITQEESSAAVLQFQPDLGYISNFLSETGRGLQRQSLS